MKQTFFLLTILIITGASCKKTTEILYRAPHDNVYFDFSSSADRDSVIYTFAFDPEIPRDTVLLPVRISGIRVDSIRTFRVMVVDSGTTAKPGIHYVAFKDSYTMPANQGTVKLPVILLNADTALKTRSVALNLKLVPGDGLDTSINTIIKARVILSNKLEKPSWWDKWRDILGAYSMVKHTVFLITTNGVREVSLDGLEVPRVQYYQGVMNALLMDPFKWVADNPTKGYTLTLRADGAYDFYNTANPAQTLLVRKNTAAGRFYFIDENGLEVN